MRITYETREVVKTVDGRYPSYTFSYLPIKASVCCQMMCAILDIDPADPYKYSSMKIDLDKLDGSKEIVPKVAFTDQYSASLEGRGVPIEYCPFCGRPIVVEKVSHRKVRFEDRMVTETNRRMVEVDDATGKPLDPRPRVDVVKVDV